MARLGSRTLVVGGDFYDVIRCGNGNVLFCIADVTGHGVPAAMGAAMLKALVLAATQRETDPAKLIGQVHAGFSRVTLDSDFASMMLARWDPLERVLRYVSAGHETAYLVCQSGQVYALEATGPLLGIEGLEQWTARDIRVARQSRLVMVTDGIADTTCPEGNMFGRQRIGELVRTACVSPLPALREQFIEAVERFRGTAAQADDVTVLLAEL